MKEKGQMMNGHHGWRWRFFRLVIVCAMLLWGGVIVLFLAGRIARSELTSRYQPPGVLVDVGGHKMHLNCLGEGRPTVIMESGLNDFSVQWALVQPEVARFSRVCVYDRAGLGWSEPGPSPRTSETIVAELHTLLVNGDVTGPYLLVGHSFGGLNMRLFAERYPEEVVGLILVDAVHHEQDLRIPAYQEAGTKVMRTFRLLAFLREMGIVALFPGGVPNPGFPAKTYSEYAAILATTRFFENSNAESTVLTRNISEFRAANLEGLGDLRLAILSRGQESPVPGLTTAENTQIEQEWQQMQRELAALSTNSQQVIAEASGHNIPLQQPDLVIATIREMVTGIRTNEPLSTLPEITLGLGVLPSLHLPSTAATATRPVEPDHVPTMIPPSPIPMTMETFTLRTAFRDGQMLYIGVGGDIDGVVNPDLVVEPGTIVKATLINGDNIIHDLFFPDFDARTDLVGHRDDTAVVTFTIDVEQSGTYLYYCTVSGHRASGQEGRLVVTE